jgi:hypothetical protein
MPPEWGWVAPQTAARIEIDGISESGREALAARLPMHAGDTLTPELLSRADQTVQEFDRHL